MNKYNCANQLSKHFDALYGKRTYAQFKRYNSLIRSFKKTFNAADCNVASASGRVEFIGNHTDHNGGQVIGCAVNLDIVAAFRPNGGNTVRMLSDGYPKVEFDVSKPPQLSGGVGLIEGITTYLKQEGYAVGGFDVYTHSNVPSGAGVSSSAAFETLIATIVNACFNDGAIPSETIARAGQFAENKYLDKPCGLLDQGASVAGGMTLFDFSNGFCYDKLDVATTDLRFVLVDTGKSHAGLSHLYASIPAEMLSVARFFGKQRLVEIDPVQLYENEQTIRAKLGDRPYLRAKHFAEENARVKLMTAALRQGDDDKVIELINASGDSSMYQLQNCAVDKQDTAIADAIGYARSLGNVGARVHGGGFAGTVLCVVKNRDFKRVLAELRARYGEQRVLPMTVRKVGAVVL